MKTLYVFEVCFGNHAEPIGDRSLPYNGDFKIYRQGQQFETEQELDQPPHCQPLVTSHKFKRVSERVVED